MVARTGYFTYSIKGVRVPGMGKPWTRRDPKGNPFVGLHGTPFLERRLFHHVLRWHGGTPGGQVVFSDVTFRHKATRGPNL